MDHDKLFGGLLRAVGGGLLIAAVVLAPVAQAAAGDDLYRLLRLQGVLVKWQQTDVLMPVRLTYAVATKPAYDEEAINCRGVGALDPLLQNSGLNDATFRDALRIAIRRWEHAANLMFVPTTDEDSADILIGAQLQPRGIAFANVSLSDETIDDHRMIKRSRVCLNPTRNWKIGFDGNLNVYDLVHTLTHEIGHAIGLDHPRGADHVMSFQYRETRHTLSHGDVVGVQEIYGPPIEFAQGRQQPSTLTTRVGAVH